MDHITTQVARWSLTVKPFGVALLLDRLRITLSNRDRTRLYETINITIQRKFRENTPTVRARKLWLWSKVILPELEFRQKKKSSTKVIETRKSHVTHYKTKARYNWKKNWKCNTHTHSILNKNKAFERNFITNILMNNWYYCQKSTEKRNF
jgi:hypothetical protein